MGQRVRQALEALTGWLRAVPEKLSALVGPILNRWWCNPLLAHARRLRPLPAGVGRWLLITSGVVFALVGIAWIFGSWMAARVAGSVLVGLTMGAVLIPVLALPAAGADRVTRQMRRAAKDPRLLHDLAPLDVSWGLALTTLWQLRWLLLAALICTPALVLGVLRMGLSDFAAWHGSAEALGGATEASRAVWLLPDGRVPYFRLGLRALSAGLIVWGMVPLQAALGVTLAVRMDDISLGPLAALLASVVGCAAMVALWHWLSLTPLLAGPFEVLRLLLIGGVLAGLAVLAHRLNGINARLLFPADVAEVEMQGDAADR